MKRVSPLFLATAASLAFTILAPGSVPGAFSGEPARAGDVATSAGVTIIAIDDANQLSRHRASAPGTVLGSVTVTGLEPGESVLAIDLRPATGQLYALGSANRLYVVNPGSGEARPVGAEPFSARLRGTRFGLDFDAATDRVEIASDEGQTLRLHPETGVATATRSSIVRGVDAAHAPATPGEEASSTYVVDAASASLVRNGPTVVGALGINAARFSGFDIAKNGAAFAAAVPVGSEATSLYSVDLSTGTATAVGVLGGAAIRDIAASTTTISGMDTPCVYLDDSGAWFIRNTNDAGLADALFTYGAGGALVCIRGDWDGDGADTPGLYDAATGAFFLRNSNSAGPADVPLFTFGPGGAGFKAVVGDWDGDGDDTVGIFDPATGAFFLKNANTAGDADIVFTFGVGNASPLGGDWDGDGIDTIGIYVHGTGVFYLRNSNSNGPADIEPFQFGGIGGRTPLAGDWNNDGIDSIGIYHDNTASFFLNNSFTPGSGDLAFSYGPTNHQFAMTGDWDAQ